MKNPTLEKFLESPSLENVPFALAWLLKENADLKRQLEDIKLNFRPKEPPIYVTRKWVETEFSVNMTTVHRWVKSGKLKPYGLGNRIYFLRSEVESAIKPL